MKKRKVECDPPLFSVSALYRLKFDFDPNSHSGGQTLERPDGGIGVAVFQPAEVRLGDAGEIGQLLLRQVFFFPGIDHSPVSYTHLLVQGFRPRHMDEILGQVPEFLLIDGGCVLDKEPGPRPDVYKRQGYCTAQKCIKMIPNTEKRKNHGTGGMTMAEYIDKEQLLSELYSKQDEPLDVMKEIANFSAADVAPVVHGKWEVVKVLSLIHISPGCSPLRIRWPPGPSPPQSTPPWLFLPPEAPRPA